MWFRKVPDELQTSLTYHWPFVHQNSQCLLLTTLDLNPIGAAEGCDGLAGAIVSRSEYRPTLMTVDAVGRVRETGLKDRDGRELLGSLCCVKRRVAALPDGFPVPAASDAFALGTIVDAVVLRTKLERFAPSTACEDPFDASCLFLDSCCPSDALSALTLLLAVEVADIALLMLLSVAGVVPPASSAAGEGVELD
jgi:hypothetical protein